MCRLSILLALHRRHWGIYPGNRTAQSWAEAYLLYFVSLCVLRVYEMNVWACASNDGQCLLCLLKRSSSQTIPSTWLPCRQWAVIRGDHNALMLILTCREQHRLPLILHDVAIDAFRVGRKAKKDRRDPIYCIETSHAPICSIRRGPSLNLCNSVHDANSNGQMSWAPS